MSGRGHTPSLDDLRKAYRAKVETYDNWEYRVKGKTPLTIEEIDAEFDRAIAAACAEREEATDG